MVGGGDNKNDSTTKETVNTNEAETKEVKDEVKKTTKETPKEEPEEELIVVTAEDLAKAFEDNEISANKQYKDKMVEVTGVVQDIGEVLGSTYVTLEASEEITLTHAQCTFKDEEQIDKIAELAKGDTVTIIGKVDGKSLNVTISNCKFK